MRLKAMVVIAVMSVSHQAVHAESGVFGGSSNARWWTEGKRIKLGDSAEAVSEWRMVLRGDWRGGVGYSMGWKDKGVGEVFGDYSVGSVGGWKTYIGLGARVGLNNHESGLRLGDSSGTLRLGVDGEDVEILLSARQRGRNPIGGWAGERLSGIEISTGIKIRL